MTTYDLGDFSIILLGEDEIPAIKEIAEDSLASTYDAYHSAADEPPEEDEEDGEERAPPQFFGHRGAAYKIVADGAVIGGIFLSFDLFEPDVKTGTLSMLGIQESRQGKNIGLRVWFKIEEIHSDVRIWRLHTPAYAIRNVAFYVNQCGFVLYEITRGMERYDWHMFRLRKVMQR